MGLGHMSFANYLLVHAALSMPMLALCLALTTIGTLLVLFGLIALVVLLNGYPNMVHIKLRRKEYAYA